MIASALCRRAGREVPIFPGAERPLQGEQRQTTAPQAAALTGLDNDTAFARGVAIEFMRATIRRHPGEITLLGIGPLTNVALLFAVDPEIPGLLKSLILMCGVFTPEGRAAAHREWNAMVDSVAASIVYRSPVRIHRSIGLDVSLRTFLSKAEICRRFTSPLLAAVLELSESWFRDNDRVTFHDPLAAASIFDPELLTFARGQVSVRVGHERHVTDWRADPTGQHKIAVDVDVEGFFRHFFAVTG
jgi:inosine-uridine nucleoside N-ribohydrolase